MKKTSLILAASLSVIGMLAAGCNMDSSTKQAENAEEPAIAAGTIVYFNLDRVFAEYDMANDLRSVFETKANSVTQEINRRGTKLQNDVNAFQDKINKGLLTQSTAEIQNQKLVQQQNDFQNYANQKQQEIAEEQQVMINQISDAIKTYVDEFNQDKGYALILASQGDLLPVPVVSGSAELDITDVLLEGLNAAYVKSKDKKSE